MNRRLIREKTVCFTGHRSEKLPKGDVLKYLRIKLSEEIEKAIQDGYNTFLFGGTYGWELMAAEEVIKKRTVIDFNNPRYIRLIAVIPFGCKCQLKNVQFLESQNVQLLELIITTFFAF
ncbi:SLOG family protein [Xylanivirga thermophila]|uniref:SLOG family protein n=1 Tax=Xylanivirga thermophila TaxID=2496273 RepID=UPI00101D4042|nr:SLOG family protein [Xylanivirga thermophila]